MKEYWRHFSIIPGIYKCKCLFYIRPMHNLLKTHFGYDAFRPLQEEIIQTVLSKKDALVIMPTGGGKSLCYQLPALKFNGLTLVISPLIALMKDQVDGLKTSGIAAEFINSSLPFSMIQYIESRLKKGEIKILYIAPERLALPDFRNFLRTLDINLIAIDEAHCISEWGHDFRPEYRNLKTLRADFPEVPVIALTATATGKVREDIASQLCLKGANVFLSSFNRTNLNYYVRPKKKALDQLLVMLKKYKKESVIIYCSSRKNAEEVAEFLRREEYRALAYHAGLTADTRKQTQEKFIRDEISIMVATIAFGMGIHKPNVRLVVHFDLPKTLESYYQETGRAGRDSLSSDCILFYSYRDKIKQDFFIHQAAVQRRFSNNVPPKRDSTIRDDVIRKEAFKKLAQVIEYAKLSTCRRAYLLNYFGEESSQQNCHGCDICLTPKENFDATEITWKILSTILRTGARFGAHYIIRILQGRMDQKILERGHEKLSVFGIEKDIQSEEILRVIQLLIAQNLLAKILGEYPILQVTEEGRFVLKQRKKVILTRPKTTEIFGINDQGKTQEDSVISSYHRELFEQLRILRKTIADQKQVPPFIIFSDVSLREMAFYLPQSIASFALITGVGKAKLEEFGEFFLNQICTYAKGGNLPEQPRFCDRRHISAHQTGAFKNPYSQTVSKIANATYEISKQLLKKKLPLSEIAKRRNLTKGTIIVHLEKLLEPYLQW